MSRESQLIPAAEKKSAEDFVKKIYEESIQSLSGRFARMSGYQLTDTIKQSLSGPIFVNELLQNADDASADDVKLIFHQGYIVFSHNGKHFEEKDVIGITDANNPGRDKVKDKQAIGNKGIGFKSLFAIADYALIVSKHFSFRFDKNHDVWKDKTEGVPWQTIPIPTTDRDYPTVVRDLIQPTHVNFVFQLKDAATLDQVKQHLECWKKEVHRIVFLQNVKRFQISLEGSPPFVLSTTTTTLNAAESTKTVELDSKQVKKYITLRAKQAIEPPLLQKIAQPGAVVEKFHDAKEISVEFAFLVINDAKNCSPTRTLPKVFCYLSTGLEFGLNCLVNSDFFLQQDRRQLQESAIAKEWNLAILKMIFRLQFNQLHKLASKGYWQDVLELIAVPDSKTLTQFTAEEFEAIKKCFNEGKKTPILRTLVGTSLIKIEDAFVDAHDFVRQFGSDELKKKCIHNEVKTQAVAQQLGARPFGIEQMIGEIKKKYLSDLLLEQTDSIRFWQYMAQLLSQPAIPDQDRTKLLQCLQQHPLVLSTSGQLLSGKNIFIKPADFPFSTPVYLVKPELTPLDALKKIGVSPLNLSILIGIINGYPQHVRTLLQELFVQFKSKKLKKEDHMALALLNITRTPMQQGGDQKFTAPAECYLADAYAPQIPLERFIGKNRIVPADYIGEDQSSASEWKSFFVALRVKEQPDAKEMRAIITRLNAPGQQALLLDFTRFLVANLSLFAKDIAAEFKQLKVCIKGSASTPQFINITGGCYLANAYQPEMPLEGKVEDLPYLSETYLPTDSDEKTTLAYKDFFISIGVKERLGLTEHCINHSLDVIIRKEGNDYNKFLRDWNEETKGEDLFGRAWDSRLYISFFCAIEHFKSIAGTPFFWNILCENWEVIRQHKTVRLRNTWDNREADVPSCFTFYVETVIKEKYNVKPSQIYSPHLKPIFGDLIDAADVASALTVEQLTFFGFKSVLDFTDCTRILMDCSGGEFKESVVEKIFAVYEHITMLPQQHISSASSSSSQPSLNLLATNSTFQPAGQLHYVTNPQLSDSQDAKLIRKPNAMSDGDFKAVCQVLQVKIVENHDLRCDTKPSDEKNDFDYASVLRENIAVLAIIEGYRLDKVLTPDFIRQKIRPVLKKLNELRVILVSSLQVFYADLIFSGLSYWFDFNSSPVLYIKNNFNSVLNAAKLLTGIHAFLALRLDHNDLLKIIYSNNSSELQQHFPAIDLSAENIRRINQLIADSETSSDEKSSSSMPSQMQPTKPSSSYSSKRPREETPSTGHNGAVLPSEDASSMSHDDEVSEGESTRADSKAELVDGPTFSSKTRKLAAPSTVPVHPGARYNDTTTVSSSANTHAELDLFASPSSSSSSSLLSVDSVSPPPFSSPASSSSSMPPKKARLQLDNDQKRDVGRAGEEAVFTELKRKYGEKYGDRCVETDMGLEIKRDDGTIKRVVWHNKNGERYQSYDMEITIEKNGEVLKRKFIEVKTTLRKDSIDADFSEDEMKLRHQVAAQTGQTPRQKYQGYFVFGIFSSGSSGPSIKKIGGKAQPFEQLPSKMVTRISMKL